MTDPAPSLPRSYNASKRVRQMLAFSLLLWVIGLGLLFWADWRVAVGVFVCLWANNILRK